MPILARANRRHFLRHPLQLLLAVLGVALGVAAVVSIDLAAESAHRAFALSVEALAGRYTHHLEGAAGSLPEALLTRLRVEEGIYHSAPAVEGYAKAGATTLRLVGFDPLAERSLQSRFARAARAEDARRLMTEPDAAMLSAVTAARLGVAPGGALEVVTHGRTHRLAIVAYAEGGGPPDPALEGVLLVDIATAQEMLGRLGVLDRIDLVLAEGEAGRLRARLPPGVRLEAAAGAGAARRMSHAFELNLRAMGLLALLVGAFLIYNTMAFSVLQRRGLLAGLRVLGATRGQLLREILLEAAGLGLAGGLAGAALGLWAAYGLLGLVTRTINDLYFVLTVNAFLPDPAALLRGVGLGLACAVLAALGPAVEAAWTPPAAARARSGLEGAARRALPWLALAGLAAELGALALLQAEGGLEAALAGVFLLLAGYGLLAPAVLPGLAALAGRLAPGVAARLAVRGVAAEPSRAGLAVAALSVALAVGIGMGLMIDSFKGAVAEWLDQILQADLYVAAEAAQPRGTPPLPAGLEGKLARIRGVDRVGTGRRRFVPTAFGESELLALDPPPGRPGFRFKNADGQALWAEFPRRQAVFVSEPYASRHGLRVGDRLGLETPSGKAALPVAGIFYDYRSDQGLIVIHQNLYEKLWKDRLRTSIGLYLKPGAALEAVRAEAETILAGEGRPLSLRATREIRAASLATFDRTFAVTRVLRLLAVGVAFAGVFGALLAIQHERRRELAVLRAAGLAPAQAGRLVLLQTGFMGLAAGLLSIPAGLALAAALVRVVNLRAFGWTLELRVSPWPLAAAAGLALAAALLAGAWPARQAMRADPAEALRDE